MLDLGPWETKVHRTGAEAAGLSAQCADRALRLVWKGHPARVAMAGSPL